MLDHSLFSLGASAGHLELAGEAEEPPSLAKGLAGHAPAAGDGRIYEGAGSPLFLCHKGEEGKPLSTYDFASDDNPNKNRAREMYRMLGDISDHLKKIEPSGDKRVNM